MKPLDLTRRDHQNDTDRDDVILGSATLGKMLPWNYLWTKPLNPKPYLRTNEY